MLYTILIVLLILILLGGVGGPYLNPNWQHGYGYGWGGTGLIGFILIIVLLFWLMQGGGLGRFYAP